MPLLDKPTMGARPYNFARERVRETLKSWLDCGHLSPAEGRKVERDPRALAIGAFIERMAPEYRDYDWHVSSVEGAQVAQARCLIFARARQLCAIGGGKSQLARAARYGKTVKPMRRALADVLGSQPCTRT